MTLFKSAAELCSCPDIANFQDLIFDFAGMRPD